MPAVTPRDQTRRGSENAQNRAYGEYDAFSDWPIGRWYRQGMNCKKCGADIPAAAPGTMVRCDYCGHTELIPAPPARPRIPPVQAQLVTSQGAARAGRIAVIIAASVFLIIGVGVFVCVSAVTKTQSRQVDRQLNRANKQMARARKRAARVRKRVARALARHGVAMPAGPRGKQWKLAELDKAPKDRWFDVDPSGMTGNLDQFDAIANYAWVHKLAKAWSADAKLVRLGIERVRHDGVAPNASASGKADIDYRFYSPSRYAAGEKLAEVSEQKVYDGFRVWVREGKVQAMIGEGSPEARHYPDPPMTCSLAKILAGARHLAKVPFYDMRLRYWKHRRRWEWYVGVSSSLRSRHHRSRRHGRSSTRVRAKNCKGL